MPLPTIVANQRGLTLIEICVILSVAAITLSTAAPGFASFLEKRRLEGEASQLVADVHLARSEAARRQARVRLTLQADALGSCWLLHTGGAHDCSCETDGSATCVPGALALKAHRVPAGDRVGVSANVASMVFDPLHGTVSPAGTLKLTGASGRAINHVVNVMGRVRTCSPRGSAAPLAGYAVC